MEEGPTQLAAFVDRVSGAIEDRDAALQLLSDTRRELNRQMEELRIQHRDQKAELAAAVVEANLEVAEVVRELADLGPEERNLVVAELYWKTDIRNAQLAEAAGVSEAGLRTIARRSPPTATCGDCGDTFNLRSRQDVVYLQWGYQVICSPCRVSKTAGQREAMRIDEEAWAQYYLELKTMPYADYLQTDHWKELRKEKLKEAGNRCQVCGNGWRQGPLNVHHNTYRNRGREFLSDLLVLCRGCHEIYHREGRLPR